MSFDRDRILAAYHLALSYCHEGQGSARYARLSRLCTYYKPPRRHGHQARVDAHALMVRWGMIRSGYRHCDCETCFELTVGAAFCYACEEAQCGDYRECQAPREEEEEEEDDEEET